MLGGTVTALFSATAHAPRVVPWPVLSLHHRYTGSTHTPIGRDISWGDRFAKAAMHLSKQFGAL